MRLEAQSLSPQTDSPSCSHLCPALHPQRSAQPASSRIICACAVVFHLRDFEVLSISLDDFISCTQRLHQGRQVDAAYTASLPSHTLVFPMRNINYMLLHGFDRVD